MLQHIINSILLTQLSFSNNVALQQTKYIKNKGLSTLIYMCHFAKQTVLWVNNLKELFIAADNFLQ